MASVTTAAPAVGEDKELLISGSEAVAEALVLAEAAGVDAAKVREALLGGFAASRILEVHGQRMLDEAFQPGFRARLHLKDARIVESMAGELGVAVPALDVVRERLDQMVQSGRGDLDHSALVVLGRDGHRSASG